MTPEFIFKIFLIFAFRLRVLPLLTWELSLLVLSTRLIILLRIPSVSDRGILCLRRMRLSNLGFLLMRLRLLTLFWAVRYSSKVERGQSRPILLFLLTGLLLTLILFFSLGDTIKIYIAFELSVLPIFLIILGWGYQRERLGARFRLLFYTLTASIPLLISLLWLVRFTSQQDRRSLRVLSTCKLSTNWILRLSVFLAFAVKLPIFGFHMWLPKAHVEAPVIGSIILAAILLKLGSYGLYIFLPIYYFSAFNRVWVSVCLLGILPVRLLCLRLTDLKMIIAYSSVGHIGLIAASILLARNTRVAGAVFLILAHGISSSAIFIIAFILYQSNHSRRLLLTKGILSWRRIVSLFWFLILMANIAAPPTLNLLAEVLVIIRIRLENKINIIIIILVILVRTGYSLIIYRSRMQGAAALRAKRTLVYAGDLLIFLNQLIWVFLPMAGLSLVFID